MGREEKVTSIAELREKLGGARGAVLTDFRGLNVAEITELRTLLRKSAVEYKVVKNTLAKLAVKDTGLAGLASYLEGPTAIAISGKIRWPRPGRLPPGRRADRASRSRAESSRGGSSDRRRSLIWQTSRRARSCWRGWQAPSRLRCRAWRGSSRRPSRDWSRCWSKCDSGKKGRRSRRRDAPGRGVRVACSVRNEAL